MGLNDGEGHVFEDGEQLSSESLLRSEERVRANVSRESMTLQGKEGPHHGVVVSGMSQSFLRAGICLLSLSGTASIRYIRIPRKINVQLLNC